MPGKSKVMPNRRAERELLLELSRVNERVIGTPSGMLRKCLLDIVSKDNINIVWGGVITWSNTNRVCKR